MPRKIDLDKLPPFPKRLPKKLEAIRDRLQLTPDAIAPKVGAKTGAEILAYENDEDESADLGVVGLRQTRGYSGRKSYL
jgi:hypothetical protein